MSSLENSAVSENAAVSAGGSDLIYRETRWLAAVIVPFLLIAFYILYLRTSETKELFAWEIAAPMTSMMLASAYIGGTYFFIRAAMAKQWHHIGLGFLPVTAFASLMGISTLLHLDKFNHGHISFYAWGLLYFTTPFVVIGTWLRNRRTDSNMPDKPDFIYPAALRNVLGVMGVINLLIAFALFLVPDVVVSFWGWQLTPLTARVVSGMFALQGVFGVCLAWDNRWSSARITIQSQWVTMVFIVIAMLRTWDTFDQSRIFTWIFAAAVTLIAILVPVLYFYVERQVTSSGSSS